ncbi:MAG: hypothetical protein B6U85_09420 [Desulfurococcales archaeon ex4484_42]|nr:MAG: hypothetical protein B6U85_09420 [Desulfurococcales archaeon ex4484_42]
MSSLPPLKYVRHMYKVVSNLYVFHSNPLELLKSDYATYTFKLNKLAQAIVAVARLKAYVKELNEIIRQAERDLLTTRTITYHESWDIKGVISWPLTIINLMRNNPPIQLILKSTIYSPENILLKLVTEEITAYLSSLHKIIKSEYEGLKASLGIVRGLNDLLYGYYLINKEIKRAKNMLKEELSRSFLSLIPSSRIESRLAEIKRLVQLIKLQPWRPYWVNKLLYLASNIIDFNNIFSKFCELFKHMKYSGVQDVKHGLRYLIWRLYELYILYVLIDTIRRLIPYVKIKGAGREFNILYSSQVITILFNTSPRIKGLKSKIGDGLGKGLMRNEIPKELLKKSSGRPDLSMIEGNSLTIAEIKFTNSPSYLTQARFKILAYIYEYNAEKGFLIYPGLTPKEPVGVDEEIIETWELLRQAEDRDGMEIKLNNGSKLYLIPIKPLRKYYESNVMKFKRALLS